MRRWISWGTVGLAALLAAGCTGRRSSPNVRYEDEDLPVLLDDRYNDTDMKKIADRLVQSMIEHPALKQASKPPVVMVGNVANRTMEHIDVKSLTDKIGVSLLATGKVQLVDETARGELASEYDYQGQGYVDPATRSGPGKQVGADYFLRGDIAEDVHEAGGKKVIFYKVTLQLTDLKTNLQIWKDDVEIKKSATRGKVGW